MDDRTHSERVVAALKQLQQFQVAGVGGQTEVIHVLNGARVVAVPDPDDVGHGILEVTFPGGAPFQVIGPMYLELQIIEDSRLVLDGHEDGRGDVARHSAQTSEHLRRKHNID